MSEVLDILSTGGTLVAAWLAYVTIRQSAKTGDENQRALVRERRIDFQLGILVELSEAWQEPASGFYPERMTRLARLLPPDAIPLTRAVFGLPTTPQAAARVGPKDPRSEDLRAEMMDEIEAAVAALLNEQQSSSVSRRRWWARRAP